MSSNLSFESDLSSTLQTQFSFLPQSQIEAVSTFGRLLYEENAHQNLTRIEGVQDFIDGHLIDVLELYKSGLSGKKIVDIGSGSGVPGLLAAAIDPEKEGRGWHLIESEKSKAEYLFDTAKIMNLGNVEVHGERVEKIIQKIAPDTVMARAVGTVDKISAWIWNCSTWNNLVLFKSRGWEVEWKAAKQTKFGRKLTVTQTHEYSIGDKYRVIIKLTRA